MVPAWIAAAVAALVLLPGLERSGGTLGDLVPSDAKALRVEQASRARS